MTEVRTFRFGKIIITCFLFFLFCFFYSFVCDAKDEGEYAIVSSFDELTSALNQMMSTGGTIILDSDITVPASESYTYLNGRYRKEVLIETGGHTINVQGTLVLWPFLTVRGMGEQKELLHVYPGGNLCLVSVCLDAGKNGTAVVQEEGAFFMYGSETEMGLPEFFCTGTIDFADTMTAAADWYFNYERLPVVRVPEGQTFTADLLPDKVMAQVNRDHTEYEEEVSVIWDNTTFPDKHERTLVQGKFADGYSQYGECAPMCLIVWESDTYPFFLNVYLESPAQGYDMVFMYGQAPQAGTVYIQASDTGENWEEISGTEGYAPVEADGNDSLFWLLSYDGSNHGAERPQYYRLHQILDDGTELYSEPLSLSGQFIFTGADIEGGRGGETSPAEEANQLPETAGEMENVNKGQDPELQDTLSDPETASGLQDSQNMNEVSDFDHAMSTSGERESSEKAASVKTEKDQPESEAGIQRMIGTGIVIGILLGAVGINIFKRKHAA